MESDVVVAYNCTEFYISQFCFVVHNLTICLEIMRDPLKIIWILRKRPLGTLHHSLNQSFPLQEENRNHGYRYRRRSSGWNLKGFLYHVELNLRLDSAQMNVIAVQEIIFHRNYEWDLNATCLAVLVGWEWGGPKYPDTIFLTVGRSFTMQLIIYPRLMKMNKDNQSTFNVFCHVACNTAWVMSINDGFNFGLQNCSIGTSMGCQPFPALAKDIMVLKLCAKGFIVATILLYYCAQSNYNTTINDLKRCEWVHCFSEFKVKYLLEGLVKALFLLNHLYLTNLLFESGFRMSLSYSVWRLLKSISFPFCPDLNHDRVVGYC